MDVWIKISKYALIFVLLLGLAGVVRGGGKQVEFDALAEQILGELDLEQMQQGDERMLRRLYGLNAGDLEHWTLYFSRDNMDVEELLLLKVKTPEEAEAAEAAARKRLEVQKKHFEGYGPEQLQLLNKSVIRVEDTYLLFVVTEDPEAVKKWFSAAFFSYLHFFS